jgi:hypothetical protein
LQCSDIAPTIGRVPTQLAIVPVQGVDSPEALSFRSQGIQKWHNCFFVRNGNVYSPDTESTYSSNGCGKLVRLNFKRYIDTIYSTVFERGIMHRRARTMFDWASPNSEHIG